MLTTSEIAVTATIWGLTAVGIFFGTRATLRKKRMMRGSSKSCPTTPTDEVTARNSEK